MLKEDKERVVKRLNKCFKGATLDDFLIACEYDKRIIDCFNNVLRFALDTKYSNLPLVISLILDAEGIIISIE